MPLSSDAMALLALLMDPETAGPSLHDSPDSARLLDVKDARASAREAERLETREAPGSTEAAALRSEARRWWSAVADGAPDLLAKSRDVEVLGWYCEALLRLDGVPGLRDAFGILEATIMAHWAGALHPAENEDGPAERISSLVSLNGEEQPGALIRPLRMAALAVDQQDQPVGLWQAQTAANRPVFEAAVRATPVSEVRETYQAAVEALASYQRLGVFLRPHVGIDGFPIGYVSATLEEIASSLAGLFAPGALDPVVEVAEDAAADGADGTPARSTGPARPPGEVTSRAEAIQAMLKIADFFDRSDPHSITGQALRDITRRAQLSLRELLEELIPNGDSRKEFLVRAGILAKE